MAMKNPSLKTPKTELLAKPEIDTSIWQSPLSGRYASLEMKQLWSDDHKFKTWHREWIALAKGERDMGVAGVTNDKIEEMEEHQDEIDYETARARERECRHDVMAHVYAFGQQCPKAAGIIHLGATSCFVTDNADLLIIYDSLQLIRGKLLGVIKLLADFADEYAELPTLGYTHGQPAALTTVGKRAALWLQNFIENFDELEFVRCNMKMLGCRGATGSSETFMELLSATEKQDDEDKSTKRRKVAKRMIAEKKVRRLERLVLEYLFEGDPDPITEVWDVSGQTYPRHFDIRVLNLLASISASAYKMASDIRLLQRDKEMEEPFEKGQIGSSAMAYKRNPMRSERICSLARQVESLVANAYNTANDQWFERTLDDSANRRTVLPEAFLGVDSILRICANVTNGLVVNEKVIERRVMAELPFIATENILMRAVQKGGNRQELHEQIRVHSMAASQRVKQEGLDNNLIELIASDPAFAMTEAEIRAVLNPSGLTGRCAGQVRDYLQEWVNPLLVHYSGEILVDTEVNV